MNRLILLLVILQASIVSAQQIDFKSKIDFFQLPNFELNTDEITDIQTDNEGHIWIISFSSIHKYNGSKFIKINTNNVNHGSFIRLNVDPHGRKYVFDYLNNIFFIEGNKLIPFEHNKLLRATNVNANIPSFMFGENGEFHISLSPMGYSILKDGSLIKMNDHYPPYRGLGLTFINGETPFIFKRSGKIGIENEPVYFVIFDDKGEILDSVKLKNRKVSEYHSLVQKQNGNYLYSTGKGTIIEFSRDKVINQYVYPNRIIRLFIDQAGNLWVGTKDDGIHFYRDAKIDSSQRIKYLEKSMAFVSTQDYQGGIWLYSKKQGLGYMSNPELEFDLNASNYQIDLKGKNLFYAAERKIWKYTENEESSHLFHSIDHKESPISIYYDTTQDRMVVSSQGEVSYIQNDEASKVGDQGIGDHGNGGRLLFLQADPQQPSTILGHTDYQYFKYDANNSFSYVSDFFPNILLNLLKDGDSVWVKCTDGLYLSVSDSIQYMGNQYPLAQNYTSDLVLFKKKVFFSFPNKGVYYFSDNEFKEIRYRASSLLNCRLVRENDSVLWAISADGCFNITQLEEDNSTYAVKAYPPLPRLAINKIKSNDKYIYFTTQNGYIVRIAFKEIREPKVTKPNLLITKVEAIDSVYHHSFDEIALPYNSNQNIQINFEGLNFQNLNLSYRYRLENSDDQWHTTSNNSVNYASLPSGKYTFKVQSRFGLGEWSEAATIPILIPTPYWQESWFILGLILVLLFAISQIIAYRYKIKYKQQQLAVEQLRSEQKALRALMTPHYLFNFITSLQYLIIEETREKTSRFLELFARSMRSILSHANSKNITIENEINFITEYLEMERFRLEKCFDFEVEVGAVDRSAHIPPFIIQPFVENAIQHGLMRKETAGKLLIKFENEAEYLKVIVKDNGIGRESSEKNKKEKESYGINLIKKRLVFHNDSKKGVSIKDLYNEKSVSIGTEVTLYIKRVAN